MNTEHNPRIIHLYTKALCLEFIIELSELSPISVGSLYFGVSDLKLV